jgi:hypothetical protein
MSNLNIADKHTLKYIEEGVETKTFQQLLPETLYPSYLPKECEKDCWISLQAALELYIDRPAKPQDISGLVLYTHPSIPRIMITHDGAVLGSIVIDQAGDQYKVTYQPGLTLTKGINF